MSWRETLRDHAKSLGRKTWESDAGIGIDFEDGCDAFWVLPGDVTSTVPVPADGPASVDELIARYDAISRVREGALLADVHVAMAIAWTRCRTHLR